MENRRSVRRRVHTEREAADSVDRWMVSYADFITLLFAMFVVLYGISQVSETKYRVLADAFRSNFTGAAPPYPARPQEPSPRTVSDLPSNEIWTSFFRELTVTSQPVAAQAEAPLIELPSPAVAEGPLAGGEGVAAQPLPAPVEPKPRAVSLPPPAKELSRVEDELRGTLGDRIGEQGILLRQTYKGLEIELNTELLFPSASERLNASVRPVLSDVARVLSSIDNSIDVEGFADDLPILTPRFYSNWELAGARAAAVVRLLIEENIEPHRLAAVSYGEFRPVVSNETDAGRARNRRVVLVIREYSREAPEGQVPAG